MTLRMVKTDEREWFTTRQLCERFGISDPTLRRWIVDPELAFPKATKIGVRLFFRISEIEAWEKRHALAH